MDSEPSTIEIDLIANPQASAPRVRAQVDGVKVQWRQRDNTRYERAPGAGWVCEEHGVNATCWHVEDVEDVLAPVVVARMRNHERRSKHWLRVHG